MVLVVVAFAPSLEQGWAAIAAAVINNNEFKMLVALEGQGVEGLFEKGRVVVAKGYHRYQRRSRHKQRE